MRIVFMGTPEFAAVILEELSYQHEIVAVYTRPDAVRGRGKELVGSPVKSVAQKLGVPVFTPRTLRDEQEVEALRALEPDVICVAAYGMILTDDVLSIPKYGCLNAHASLLPRWRGAAPIERAILAGDTEVGVCVMEMVRELDAGDYCVSRSVPCVGNAEELTARLADLGAQAMITALSQIGDGGAFWTVQDEDQVTYAAKIEKGELDIVPEDSAIVAERKVRASSDAHPCTCTIAGKRVVILSARVVDGSQLPENAVLPECGRVALVAKKHFLLGCADGSLELLQVKPAGKKAMDAHSFAAGVQNVKSGTVEWEACRAE